MNSPALRIDGLAYEYPDGVRALHDVTLQIERGERVALLGPNGSGKTTLVKHLNGILVGSSGSVAVDGTLVDTKDRVGLRRTRAAVGIVFQDPDDQLFMPTVKEDVAFGPYNMGLRGEELDMVVKGALDRVGMWEMRDRPPHHLSFGQRRKVAVATVLSMAPKIIVLDEPSSNLDPASRRELAEILNDLEITLLMVTHDLPYALELCQRSLVLADGHIVADGPTRDILRDDVLLARYRLELPNGFRVD